MNNPDPKRVASLFQNGNKISRTAGEVVHVKDTSAETSKGNFWAWNEGEKGAERKISENFLFNAKELKPLTLSLRSALMALGHITSAHAKFVKIKSRSISPDGSLGGMGYVQKISDMRRSLMNCIEALSAFTDTVYDEINAPHWDASEDKLSPRDRQEVKKLIQESQVIKDDPEIWAEESEESPSVPPPDELPDVSTDIVAKMASFNDIDRLAKNIMASSKNRNFDPDSDRQIIEVLSSVNDFIGRK